MIHDYSFQLNDKIVAASQGYRIPDIEIKEEEDNLDGLNYLAGKGLDYVNKKAMEGTIDAHVSGDVPNIVLQLPDLSEEAIGYEKYYEGLKDYGYGSHGLTEDCASLIRWYLDTRKEKIALKALHRREESFKRLEAEHKKLVEAAGLVDKAEELEEQDPSKKGDEINGE